MSRVGVAAPNAYPGEGAHSPDAQFLIGSVAGMYCLVLLGASNLFNYLDRKILAILLPLIKADLALSDAQLGFISGVTFAVFYLLFGMPMGRLADRVNRVYLLSASMFLWSGMTALSGMATSFWQLAFARSGVAIGEAGSSPPALSLIADRFAMHSRSLAMSIYSAAAPVGAAAGLVVGGYVGQHYGWRAACMVVGIPGIIIAIIMALTLRDPRNKAQAPAKPDGVRECTWGVREFLNCRTYRHAFLVSCCTGYFGYAVPTWFPSYLQRTFGIDLSGVGALLGTAAIVGGVLGALLGGWFSGRAGRKDPKWWMLLPGLVMVAAVPAFVLAMLATDPILVIVFYMIPNIGLTFFNGALYATVSAVVPSSSRATAIAAMLVGANLIGMGLGPYVVGVLSDLLAPTMGVAALRYAMLVQVIALAGAAVSLVLGSRHIKSELRRD